MTGPRKVPRPRAAGELPARAARACAAAHGVPFALVSASPRVVMDSVVGGPPAQVPFAFTLSADDTPRTKPHPDPYRAAAERLGLVPQACAAVEDSPDGAASSEAAGCRVPVVQSLLPVPRSRSPWRTCPRRIWAGRPAERPGRRARRARRQRGGRNRIGGAVV